MGERVGEGRRGRWGWRVKWQESVCVVGGGVVNGMLTPAVLNVLTPAMLTHGVKLCCRSIVNFCVAGAHVTPSVLLLCRGQGVGGSVCHARCGR